MSFSSIKQWKKQFTELLKLPIITTYDRLISKLEYKNDNKFHRNTDLGPAIIRYWDNGQISSKQYWVNNQLHRPTEEGPAVIEYYENGNLYLKSYYVNGHHHRPIDEGPAFIWYHEDGRIKRVEHWGSLFTKNNII